MLETLLILTILLNVIVLAYAYWANEDVVNTINDEISQISTSNCDFSAYKAFFDKANSKIIERREQIRLVLNE